LPGCIRLGTRKSRAPSGLELGEALVDHAPADRSDHARAQQDVLMDALAAQIEEPVAQPDLLARILVAIDLERQHLGGGKQLEGLGLNLDLAGRQLAVDRLGAALHHLAVDAHHELRARALDRLEDRARGIHHALGDPVMVPEVQEQQVAVVAFAVHPTGKSDFLAGIGKAEGAAIVGPVGMHGRSLGSPEGRKTGG
jgi:hypothetical protein